MAKFILGIKLNMTQKFTEDGLVVPVTVVEAGPNTVVQVKTAAKDKYSAVQIGFGIKNKRGLSKPMAGHLKGLDSFRYLKEFRVESSDNFSKGKIFDVTSFAAGDKLQVTAASKGKGFQGVVRRHGFRGSPATHGHKDQHRMPGSVGATDPARVFKGTRMGGRMGTDTVTVKNLELIEVDVDKNLLYIKGAVPGSRNSLVTIVADGEIIFVEKPKKEVLPETKAKTEEPKKEEIKNKDKVSDGKKAEVKVEEPKKEVTKEEK